MTLPRVLPAWVAQASMYVEELDDATAKAIALPPAYLMATPDRQRAFRVGRVCASRALEQIGVRGAMPGVHENGGPAWPNGTVGSITHAMSLVAAAVAARRQCGGIGIDIEPIGSLERAHSLASRGATTSEVFGVMENLQVDYATAVAVILSAKHSLYKCVHPQVGRSFSYLDASVEDVQRQTGRFRARLKVMLSSAWVGGTSITGQFDIAGDFVHTGIAIPC